jgi:type VI secretion system protein ImpK
MSASLSLLPVALRDTALTVATLADEAMPIEFASFRSKCDQQVERLRNELDAAGHAPDVVEDALYAQCALLDETALHRLQGTDRDAWEREPLQVRQFHTHDAGEELIKRIEKRLADTQPAPALMSIFAAVLGLGFTGKFVLNGADARDTLVRSIDQQLGVDADRDIASTVLIAEAPARRRWFGHVSLIAWVAIAGVVAAAVYIALEQWLTAAIARLAN